MIRHLRNLGLLALFGTMVLITSCDSDADQISVENFTTQSVFDLQKQMNAGRMGCFELVFPIEILFADGTTFGVGSYEELHQAIREWKENNPDILQRPALIFPIEIIARNGELFTVESHLEMMTLRKRCHDHFGDRPSFHRFCFQLVYPVTVDFPDSTSVEVGSRIELKMAIREWKQNNPDTDERPTLAFPLEVELRDGTTVTVESQEDLHALKEECRNG